VAFQELKQYLTLPPIMVAPDPSEPLLLYIMATADTTSMALVVKRPESNAEEAPGSQLSEAPSPETLRWDQYRH
jgi:hypothetical protein